MALKDQIKDLAAFANATALAALKGEAVKATPEEATRRYNTCVNCPFLVAEKCTKCGCKMGMKVQWQAAKCGDKENPKW